MWLSLSRICLWLVDADVTPPAGSISPLAWAIIGALVTVICVTIPALWFRGNSIQDRMQKRMDEVQDKMYADLKECNEKKLELEDEVLDLMKLLRLQMEQSKVRKKL